MVKEWKGCLKCKHFNSSTGGCKAFPERIPITFASGDTPHFDVVPGQIGKYVFEEIVGENIIK